MRLLPLLAVPALALALSACSEAQDAADSVSDTARNVQDCAGLGRDVAGAGLNRVPTQAEAEAAQKRLDERVDSIGDTTIKEAAGHLSDKVGELSAAVRSADQAAISAKLNEARDAARRAAGACSLPVGSFLP